MLSDRDPMPIRAVIFDLFDTLVDLPMETLPRVAIGGREIHSTLGALHAVVAERANVELADFVRVIAAVDRERQATHYERDHEFPTDERFSRVAKALGLADPELPGLLTDAHMGAIESLAATPAHHVAVLATLRERFRIGLCSNFSWAPTARSILDASGLRPALDAVVVSHERGLRKPRREIFAATLDALGVAPDEAAHVGDNLKADVGGAAALGIRTVWITRCVADPAARLAKHDGPRPDHVIADLAELDALLV
jgi:putative hydrolase of the HAD superfamily